MSNKFSYIFLGLFMCFSCSFVYAQSSASLSLDEALSIALRNNPNILEFQQRMKIADFKYKNSRTFANPELEIEVGKLAHDIESQSKFEEDNLEGEVRLSQPLQTFGKRRLNIDIANDDKYQAEFKYKEVLADISRQVKEQYSEALLHQKSVDLFRDNLDRSQRLLEQVNIRFNEGKARNHELARSKLEVANSRNDFLQAKNNANISIGKLNILLGRGMQEDIYLQDDLVPEELEEDFDQLFQIALVKRPDVLIQGLEVSKMEKELKLAKRQRLPDIHFGLFVEKEEEELSAGVGVSFELPVWNQFQYEIKEASLNREIAERNLEALKNEVELDVYMAFKNADLARKSIQYLQESIKEANELLRIITIEYQEGEASFLIYLEGLASYKKTKQEYLEALASYAGKLAVLEQAIGEKLDLKESR